MQIPKDVGSKAYSSDMMSRMAPTAGLSICKSKTRVWDWHKNENVLHKRERCFHKDHGWVRTEAHDYAQLANPQENED